MPDAPTLSVVLPTFNESAWLPDTLGHLGVALRTGGFEAAQVLIVDDGSTDDTVSVLARLADDGLALDVLSLPNSGRLAARRAGLEAAAEELVLFIDSRVHIHPGALAFVRRQLDDDPTKLIWNAHAVTASTNAPWTRFWDAVTFLAWRRYLRNPRTTSYGEEEFDWYPKGTTCFLAPKQWLIEAGDTVESHSAEPKLANDDTLMIRNLLRFGRINISPDFGCTYHPRSTFESFVRNAYHRGSVLVDGHLRPGLRLYRPFQAVAGIAPFVALWALRSPRRILGGGLAASAGAGIAARVAGVPTRDAASFGALIVPFVAAYGAGVVRGFGVRSRRPETSTS